MATIGLKDKLFDEHCKIVNILFDAECGAFKHELACCQSQGEISFVTCPPPIPSTGNILLRPQILER